MIFGKTINRYYLKHLPVILLGIIALIAVDYFQLKIPELYKLVLNGISYGEVTIDGETLPFTLDLVAKEVCLPLIFVLMCLVVGRFLWRICFFGSAISVATSIRGRMFDRCKDLSVRFYHENKVGGLMSLFTNDIETVNECFGDGTMRFFDAIALGALAIYKMQRMNKTLTLLSMIPMVLLLTVSAIVGKKMKERWRVRQEAFSSLSDFAQESFSGISVVKAFVKELRELMAFKSLNRKNAEANVRFTSCSVLLHIFVTLFVESVVCIILGYGGYLVYNNDFQAGDLIEFIGYFTSVVWPVMALSQLIEMSSRGKASLRRIDELLNTESDVTDREGAEDIECVRGDIELRGLTFRYPGADYDALTDITLKINAGENVGIIGRTGSGKTTLVDLLLRTYNVPDGTVLVDGRDVNSLTVRSLRAAFSYVPQDNFLFSDTIAANIAFGVDGTDPDRVREAAIAADVHDNVIGFSLGYDTVLGERGVGLSGGERQRVSIARAMLKNPSILVFDEATASVDSETEHLIQEAIERLISGRTTIMIAHRLSTLSKANKIVVVDKGEIIECGSPDELLALKGKYYRLVEIQSMSEKVKEAKKADNFE